MQPSEPLEVRSSFNVGRLLTAFLPCLAAQPNHRGANRTNPRCTRQERRPVDPSRTHTSPTIKGAAESNLGERRPSRLVENARQTDPSSQQHQHPPPDRKKRPVQGPTLPIPREEAQCASQIRVRSPYPSIARADSAVANGVISDPCAISSLCNRRRGSKLSNLLRQCNGMR